MSADLERRLKEALAERDEYRALAEKLAAQVELLQAVNESAYLEAYQAHVGPHFCPDRPFGQLSEQVAP